MDRSRNAGLQIGRAVAALSVAYFHSYIALRVFPEAAQYPIRQLSDSGFLGVNLFFAISGYVICIVASRPDFSPWPFAIKRVFRLYPMYWITMLLIVLLIIFGKYRIEPLGHFLYSMTLLPQSGAPAFDPSWTLERELVFYALAALVVPLGGVPALALALASLAFAGWWFGNPWSFHLISTVQSDFLAGVIVFLGHDRLRWLGGWAPIVFGTALLAYTRTHDFAFSVPVSFAVILLGMVNLRLPTHWLPVRMLVALGDASYSIYLLHYIVFMLSVLLAAQIHLIWQLPLPDWLCEPWRFLTLAVCCAISYLTFRSIEQPFIRIGIGIAGARTNGLKKMAPPLGTSAVARLEQPD
jgi:peptidoglycan/LPS O-acetylase OafA/YrhL